MHTCLKVSVVGPITITPQTATSLADLSGDNPRISPMMVGIGEKRAQIRITSIGEILERQLLNRFNPLSLYAKATSLTWRRFVASYRRMEHTLHEHLVHLDERIQTLRDGLTRPVGAVERARILETLRIVELARSHYVMAIELEQRIA